MVARKPKSRSGLRLRFKEGQPGLFNCREEAGDDIQRLPAGSLKFYYSMSFLPEPFDKSRYLEFEWEPAGNIDNYANEWWSNYYADVRHFRNEKTGMPGEEFPIWCLGIDFKSKRGKAKK